MKYKLLKYIEEENSISIGSIFEPSRPGYVYISNGLEIPVEILIEQGFIEEVKESKKPIYKVGDYAVRINSDGISFTKISKIEKVYKGEFLYDGCGECCFRDPTPSELSLYFR